jgi:hypothetical protein
MNDSPDKLAPLTRFEAGTTDPSWSSVRALAEDRFRITAPGHEHIVTGYPEPERAAYA